MMRTESTSKLDIIINADLIKIGKTMMFQTEGYTGPDAPALQYEEWNKFVVYCTVSII